MKFPPSNEVVIDAEMFINPVLNPRKWDREMSDLKEVIANSISLFETKILWARGPEDLLAEQVDFISDKCQKCLNQFDKNLSEFEPIRIEIEKIKGDALFEVVSIFDL